MPVRRIPKSHRAVTGRLPSPKNGRAVGFESTLERDYLTLLEFDVNVAGYEEQPVRIDFVGPDGAPRHYTPDVLVWYRPDLADVAHVPPTLCEVKYRAELTRDWAALRRRLRAGHAYAAARGWRFRLVTEREIRTPYLTNARFLLPYAAGSVPHEADVALLHAALRELRVATPEVLIRTAFADATLQARALASLWFLVARQRVAADLSRPLTMRTPLWVPA